MTRGSEEVRVAAVVVNFNGGELLTDCVGALLAVPTVGDVIVVDNASTDASLMHMERRFGAHERLIVLRNAVNRGYGSAVNLGLARAGTEFALIVNPDCVVGAAMIGALLGEADATPRAAVCGGVVLSSDGSLQNATRRHYPSPGRALRRALRWPTNSRSRLNASDFDRSDDPLTASAEDVDAVSGALMLVRMNAVREIGGLDEGYFLHCEDLDWCIRFKQAGWRVRFVPAGFAVHAKGASGGVRPWRIRWHMHRGMTRFYLKFEARSHGWAFNAMVLTAIWLRFAIGVLAHPLRVRLHPLASYAATVAAVRRTTQLVDGFEPPGSLLIGATGTVARYVLDNSPEAPGCWLAVSRSGPPIGLERGVVRMRSFDGGNLPGWARRRLRHVVHLAPLWTLPPYLESLRDVPLERVVACSSTSVVTRRNGAGASDRALARQLADAEEAVRAHCAERGIELVLLRPTLIYSPGRDRNVERIARLVRRFGIFPIAGYGTGLRQPVHAEDVAHAVCASLRSHEAAGRCYTVSGAEALTYREMVERVFRAAGRRPRFISIPVAPYRIALLSLAWVLGDGGVDPGAAGRMDDDFSFDHDAAARDLGFRPRAFMEPG